MKTIVRRNIKKIIAFMITLQIGLSPLAFAMTEGDGPTPDAPKVESSAKIPLKIVVSDVRPVLKSSEYYKPCADLLKGLGDGNYETELLKSAMNPAQVAQLMLDYRLLEFGVMRKVVIDLLVDKHLLQSSGEIEALRLGLNKKRRGVTTDSLFALAKESDENFNPLVWQVLEKVKALASTNESEARGHVVNVQMGRLIEALKANNKSREMVEKIVSTLIRSGIFEIVKEIWGMDHVHDLSSPKAWSAEVGLVAAIDLGLIQAMGLEWQSASPMLVVMCSVLAGMIVEMGWFMATYSENPIFATFVDKIRKIRGQSRNRNRYRKIINLQVQIFKRNELANLATEVEIELSESQARAKTNGSIYANPENGELAISIAEACNEKNICDLSWPWSNRGIIWPRVLG